MQGSNQERHPWGTYLLAFASGLLALALLSHALQRALPLEESSVAALALASLGLTALQWGRAPQGAFALLSFLPALPLAALAQVMPQGSGGAPLAATAFALEARRWLARAAGKRRDGRISLARAIEARLPSEATIFVDNDIESQVPASSLREGHIFRLGPGTAAPADGMVTFGSGFVDESLLPEGAERLELKGPGSFLHAGSIGKSGSLLVRATGVGERSFAAQLVARLRGPGEIRLRRVVAADLALTAAAALLLAFSGPLPALHAFLAASGLSGLAALESFEAALAAASAGSLWIWRAGGLRRFARAGLLVVPQAGVVSEGRLRLAAVECTGDVAEDGTLALLGPLARKIETPAAFALLQELRSRNIPLQQGEFFQPNAEGTGGMALVAGEELRWVTGEEAEPGCLGELRSFVEEHGNAGDELCFLEREGRLEAALAFRSQPLEGAADAAQALGAGSLPVLLVSPQPKPAVARLQSALGLEHAQGGAGAAEAERLVARLAEERLAPAWAQTGALRPRAAVAVAAVPLSGESGDLVLPNAGLPRLAPALLLGRLLYRRLRLSLAWIFSLQVGLLLLLVGLDTRLAPLSGGGEPGIRIGVLALVGVLPGFLAWIFLSLPASVEAERPTEMRGR